MCALQMCTNVDPIVINCYCEAMLLRFPRGQVLIDIVKSCYKDVKVVKF